MRYHGEGLYQWDARCHVAPDGPVPAFDRQQTRPGGAWYGSRSGDVGLPVDQGRAELRDLELLSLD
jgi:hypothetical protein